LVSSQPYCCVDGVSIVSHPGRCEADAMDGMKCVASCKSWQLNRAPAQRPGPQITAKWLLGL